MNKGKRFLIVLVITGICFAYFLLPAYLLDWYGNKLFPTNKSDSICYKAPSAEAISQIKAIHRIYSLTLFHDRPKLFIDNFNFSYLRNSDISLSNTFDSLQIEFSSTILAKKFPTDQDQKIIDKYYYALVKKADKVEVDEVEFETLYHDPTIRRYRFISDSLQDYFNSPETVKELKGTNRIGGQYWWEWYRNKIELKKYVTVGNPTRIIWQNISPWIH